MKLPARRFVRIPLLSLVCLSAICGGSQNAAAAPEAVPRLPEDVSPYSPPAAEPEAPAANPEEPVTVPSGSCEYFSADMTWSGSYGNEAWTLDRILSRQGDAASLGCLNNKIRDIEDICHNYQREIKLDASVNGTFSKNHDDCFVAQLANWAYPEWSGNSQKIGTHSNGAECTALLRTDLYYCPPDRPGPSVNSCHTCAEGHFFFNNNCQVVRPDENQKACGSIKTNYQLSCPVSLVWDDGANPDSKATAVQFPLDPQGQNRWFEWKASADAPLLVYDPEHTGKITSSFQLIGNWTFGGQKVASLAADGMSARPWKDGYEVLGSFDANGSGALDGAELDKFGLWFDKNQNGVSEPGEVKSLRDVQVTKIYFKSDSVDKATGSIRAALGYEREIDGRKVTGASIDWFAASARTPFELIATNGLGTLPDSFGKDFVKADALTESQTAKLAASSLSGAWEFRFSDAKNPSKFPDGYLVLKDDAAGGKVHGFSVVDKGVRVKGSAEILGNVSTLAIHGKKKIGANNEPTLEFWIGSEGSKIGSKAVISADAGSLTGTTFISLDGKTVAYKWTAVRAQGRKS